MSSCGDLGCFEKVECTVPSREESSTCVLPLRGVGIERKMSRRCSSTSALMAATSSSVMAAVCRSTPRTSAPRSRVRGRRVYG